MNPCVPAASTVIGMVLVALIVGPTESARYDRRVPRLAGRAG